MRFGVQVEPQFGFPYERILEIASEAVENGLPSVWFSDHFMLNREAGDRILLDPWLVMAALSRDTEDVRLGGLVFCNSYRMPTLHAKMGATLDVLSNGRLEFGIGAGWKEIEYRAYGYEFPPAPTRIAQLSEALQIIRCAWTEERFSFHGNYYHVEEHISYPKPVQRPHPTIWVGTMTAGPKMVDVAAHYGDGINVAWRFRPEECKRIFDELDDRAEKYGRKRGAIKRSVGLWTHVFASEAEYQRGLESEAARRGISVEQLRERVSTALWGTVDQVADRLREYEELNVEYAILMFPHGEELDQMRLLRENVV